MERTQVYLTKELKQQIKLTSLLEKKPTSVIIRETLEKGFNKPAKKVKGAGQAFLELAELGKKLKLKGPTDLSINHDKYLYEEE